VTKEKFLKAYSNLLADERDQIVVIIDAKPYTWNRAYDEIKKDTKLGKLMLDKISKIGLIT